MQQDRPFSAAASVYISSEAWETQNHQTFQFQHQSTGYLRTRGQETLYETCACVIHIYLYTLSAACAIVLSSYINVCAGCFVKL